MQTILIIITSTELTNLGSGDLFLFQTVCHSNENHTELRLTKNNMCFGRLIETRPLYHEASAAKKSESLRQEGTLSTLGKILWKQTKHIQLCVEWVCVSSSYLRAGPFLSASPESHYSALEETLYQSADRPAERVKGKEKQRAGVKKSRTEQGEEKNIPSESSILK